MLMNRCPGQDTAIGLRAIFMNRIVRIAGRRLNSGRPTSGCAVPTVKRKVANPRFDPAAQPGALMRSNAWSCGGDGSAAVAQDLGE